jgi:hypothetical protein
VDVNVMEKNMVGCGTKYKGIFSPIAFSANSGIMDENIRMECLELKYMEWNRMKWKGGEMRTKGARS